MSLRKCSILFGVLVSIFVLLVFNLSLSSAERFDILIKNAKIVDGTGKAVFKGSVAIKGEKIVAVGNVSGDAVTVIDAKGLIICPGFIDVHSHADTTIAKYPLAENFVMQGITTFVGGNCAFSPAPLENLSFNEWLSKVEKLGISINYVPLVGHSPIRTLAMGKDFRRKATPAEIDQMKTYVEEAMKSGAFGFSSGLDYPPSRFAEIGELVELAKVVRKYGGIYVSHTRHGHSQWFTDDPAEVSYGLYYGPAEDVWVGRYRGYLEAIQICREANIPLQISHFINCYKIPQPHPDFLEEAAAKASLAEIVDKARQEGLDVTFDVFACSTTNNGQQPLTDAFYSERNASLSWVRQFDKKEFIEKLKTKEFRKKIRRIYDSGRIKFCMDHTKEDPYWMDCFEILRCKNRAYEGKTIGEIARQNNGDPLEMIFDILVEDPDTIWVQSLDKRFTSGAIAVFLKHPYAAPCVDEASLSARLETGESELPSPTAYGMFPHYIGTYVRETGLLSLEEAVKKVTYFVAQRFGLKDRGVLTPGAYADLVIFDLKTIKMTGTYANPNLPPDGIDWVLVNGKVVYKEKAHTGERSGKVLRHS